MLSFAYKYVYMIFNKAAVFEKVLPGRQGKQHDQLIGLLLLK